MKLIDKLCAWWLKRRGIAVRAQDDPVPHTRQLSEAGKEILQHVAVTLGQQFDDHIYQQAAKV